MENYEEILSVKSTRRKKEKIKTKRLHIYVSDEINELIRKECDARDTTISKYIINKATDFDTSSILKQLTQTAKMLRILKQKKVLNVLEEKEIATVLEEIETDLSEGDKQEGKLPAKSKGLHIRMNAKTYDALKAKADKYSMSMSDYVGFTAAFDIGSISKKLDAIYALLLKAVEKVEE